MGGLWWIVCGLSFSTTQAKKLFYWPLLSIKTTKRFGWSKTINLLPSAVTIPEKSHSCYLDLIDRQTLAKSAILCNSPRNQPALSQWWTNEFTHRQTNLQGNPWHPVLALQILRTAIGQLTAVPNGWPSQIFSKQSRVSTPKTDRNHPCYEVGWRIPYGDQP